MLSGKSVNLTGTAQRQAPEIANFSSRCYQALSSRF